MILVFSFTLWLTASLTGIFGKQCHDRPSNVFHWPAFIRDTINETDVQEVLYLGSPTGPLVPGKQLCKMQCKDGKWMGPICVQRPGPWNFKGISRACHLGSVPDNLILTYKGKAIQESTGRVFESGSVVLGRCSATGKMKQVGDSYIECHDGKWIGTLPSCLDTNFHDDSEEDLHPPAIEWSVSSGAAQVDDDGSLVVLPKTILHLYCFVSRANGDPQWLWDATEQMYPTGWTSEHVERDTVYRLSILHASDTDSGYFKCVSPKGHSNGIFIKVKEVSCPVLKVDYGLLEVKGSKLSLGSHRNFTCPLGYALKGEATIECLPSGHWSGEKPSCEVIECPQLLIEDSNLKVKYLNRSYFGKAVFRCPRRFSLRGHSQLTCLKSGKWSHNVPSCHRY